MIEWITDREPTAADARPIFYVWITSPHGNVHTLSWDLVDAGTPWQPIVPPEPYVKAKRWQIRSSETGWQVFDDLDDDYANAVCIPTREAAERIAAIYEEVMP